MIGGDSVKCVKCNANLQEGSVYCHLCGKKQIKAEKKQIRRANGLGSAKKRGSTWTAVWTVATYKGEDGKTRQKVKTKGGFPNKTAALAFACNPEPDQGKKKTLRDYWGVYEKGKLKKLSANKQCAYNIAWKKMSSIADIPISTIKVGQLQDVVNEKGKTYDPSHDMRSVFSHLFKLAMADGEVRVNLSQLISLPEHEEKEPEPFTERELVKLWAAYDEGDRIIGACLLMIYSGMMPGELFQLKATMIDWDRREVIKGGIKTAERKKTPIVFPEMIIPVLQHLIDTTESKQGFVLGINKDKFYKLYHKSIEAAGVRDLPPYSCRHTTATALAMGNQANAAIQKVMRHAKFSTTERYIHPDMTQAHAAIDTLQKPGR